VPQKLQRLATLTDHIRAVAGVEPGDVVEPEEGQTLLDRLADLENAVFGPPDLRELLVTMDRKMDLMKLNQHRQNFNALAALETPLQPLATGAEGPILPGRYPAHEPVPGALLPPRALFHCGNMAWFTANRINALQDFYEEEFGGNDITERRRTLFRFFGVAV
jgi:hypothetical protein